MDTVLKIIEILKWPIVIIIIAMIFKKSISSLINRTKSIKGGKYGLEIEPSKQQKKVSKRLPETKSKKEEIEKRLNLLSDDTRNKLQEAIKKETDFDKLNTEEDKIEAILRYSEVLYIILNFERIYYLIFGSQIRLLNHLNSSYNQTINMTKFFYDNAVGRNPHLKDYSYEQYLSFLQNEKLVVIGKDETIQITLFGRDFLKYMIDTGLSDLKAN